MVDSWHSAGPRRKKANFGAMRSMPTESRNWRDNVTRGIQRGGSRQEKRRTTARRSSATRRESRKLRGAPPPMPGGAPRPMPGAPAMMGGPSMAGGPPMAGGAPPIMMGSLPMAAGAPPIMMGGPPIPGGPPMPGVLSGGPPMPMTAAADSFMPVQAQRESLMAPGSKPVLATKQSSILSDASTPDNGMADTFLANLNCDAVKSAADQQEARMAVCQDDWDMSDEEEVEALLEIDAPIQMKVALEFKWLLNQQSANGMFKFSPLDPRFLDYKKKNISSAVEEKLKDVKNLNSVLATLYALASMTTQFASQKTEWQFMFSKGKRWVSKQLKEMKDFEDLLALLV